MNQTEQPQGQPTTKHEKWCDAYNPTCTCGAYRYEQAAATEPEPACPCSHTGHEHNQWCSVCYVFDRDRTTKAEPSSHVHEQGHSSWGRDRPDLVYVYCRVGQCKHVADIRWWLGYEEGLAHGQRQHAG